MIWLSQRINVLPLAVAGIHAAFVNTGQALVVLSTERKKMNTNASEGWVIHRQTISARVQEVYSASLPRPVFTGFSSYNQ